jgi:hypothetical protein
MSRSELSREATAELAALDAILAGEAVSDEHLELAALVESVRRTSPALDEAGRARIDARLRDGRPRRKAFAKRPTRRTGFGRVALAGGPLLAVVVAIAVVVGSGALNGSKPQAGLGVGIPRTSHALPTLPAAGGPAAAPSADLGANGTAGESTHAPTPAAAGTTNFTSNNLNPSHRLVAQGASLTLASPVGQMQTVANEVVSNTERLGGIVESSSVNVHGASSYSSFTLSVPSTRLAQLISALSSLTAVRSLDQSTNDITNSYDQATAKLADEKAQRAALIKALAGATTLTQEQTIQQEINHLDNKIAAASHSVAALLTRGHNATVALQIVAGAAGASGSGGPVNRALNDALSVLDVALAIALVALAIVLPLGLVALLLLWGSATLRQRSRERALATSA